ncbi:MAG: hypothetical protein R3E58_16860 [Phycisphaerae bacterium]
MSLVATLMMTVPAMGQEAPAPATGDDPKPMTEVKPVTNSDTQTIEPGAKSDSGEMTPAADEAHPAHPIVAAGRLSGHRRICRVLRRFLPTMC